MLVARKTALVGAGLLLLLSGHPAQSQSVKPPVRGLVSMGAYKFVGSGGQPVNTMAPLLAKPGIFGGIVVVPSWEQLQPTANGPLAQNNPIDQMLTQIRQYNLKYPKAPLAVKLRVWGGFMAPFWAKRIGGPAIHAVHNNKNRTVGRFWSPAYRTAFANLQKLLAAKYDGDPLIREVSITQCMSFTSEPFFVPIENTVLPILTQAGFTTAAYETCLSNAVADYAPWKKSRLVLSVNPLRTELREWPANTAFTETVMKNCRTQVGVRCVFDNHDLATNLPRALSQIYTYIKTSGPEIEFQTAQKSPTNFPAVIKMGVSYGASAIELYQDYGGFPLVPNATLQQWASWIAVNTGVAKSK
jgi:hypothetical protein